MERPKRERKGVKRYGDPANDELTSLLFKRFRFSRPDPLWLVMHSGLVLLMTF